MFTMSFDTTVNLIVETMLSRFSPLEKGLLIQAFLEIDNPKTGDGTINHICLLFRRASNATNVWVHSSQRRPMKVTEELDWENTSNHTSCWRWDGLRDPINKIYFRLCKEVAPSISPCKLENNVKWIKINYVNMETHTENNRKKIDKLEVLE